MKSKVKDYDTSPFSPRHFLTTLSLGALFFATNALAQEEEAPPAAETEEPSTEPEPTESEPVETTVEAAPTATAEVVPPADVPPTETQEPPAFAPSFTVGAGMRTGLALDLGEGTMTLNDGLVDQIQVRPFMGGSLTPEVGFWVQFEIGAGSNTTASFLPAFAILDAIAQIKFMDELQLWVGQHIPANDRNNMNGPFFGNTWNFALAAGGYPFDMGARDRGFTFWGLVAGGKLKYHLSMVDLQPGRDVGQARFAGRLTAHFFEPENFYYNSGTYFGEQDILTFGAVFQGQSGDSATPDDDLIGFSFDGMFEKNFGNAGTWTAEAGYFNFDNTGAAYVGNQYTADTGYGVSGPYPGEGLFGTFSWLTPEKVGYGKIQPNARIQYGDFAGTTTVVFDAGLAYIVDGFNHKYHLNYRHSESGPNDGDKLGVDMIQVGFQYMMAK